MDILWLREAQLYKLIFLIQMEKNIWCFAWKIKQKLFKTFSLNYEQTLEPVHYTKRQKKYLGPVEFLSNTSSKGISTSKRDICIFKLIWSTVKS